MNEEFSAGFQTAKAGYDVWFGNNRGNCYSNKTAEGFHKTRAEYYDYSFYELGKYDAPTQIDFVLEKTGQKKLSYVGHSMGTSQMFSALSEGHSHLKDKLHNFVALCPIINLGWSQDEVIVYAAENYNYLNKTMAKLHIVDIPNPGHLSADFVEAVCALLPCKVFGNVARNLFGKGSPYDRNERVVVEDQRNASVSSLKQLLHYAQSKRDQDFAQYDYGKEVNQIKYGQDMPPQIDITNIKDVHIALFVGTNDTWSVVEGAQWALERLPEDTDYFLFQDWDHSSYGVGKIPEMVYFEKVLDQLKKYNPLPVYE